MTTKIAGKPYELIMLTLGTFALGLTTTATIAILLISVGIIQVNIMITTTEIIQNEIEYVLGQVSLNDPIRENLLIVKEGIDELNKRR